MLRIKSLKISILNVHRLTFYLQLVLELTVVVSAISSVHFGSGDVRRLDVFLAVNFVVGIHV